MAPVSVGGHDVGLVSVCALVPWVVSSNSPLIFPKDNGEEVRILAVKEIPPECSQRFDHKYVFSSSSDSIPLSGTVSNSLTLTCCSDYIAFLIITKVNSTSSNNL